MKTVKILFMILCLFSINNAQELIFRMEASVNYGTVGQRLVSDGNKMYHIGGRTFTLTLPTGSGFDAYSMISSYSETDKFWQVLPVKIKSRNYLNAEYYDGKIYIFNGVAGSTFPNELEIFDIASQTITYGSVNPSPRRSAGSALVNGKIYMGGGNNSTSNYLNSLYIYDIQTNTWSQGALLPYAGETEFVAYGDQIYAFGGFNGATLDVAYKYDSATDTWTELTNMPYPTSAHKLTVFNNYILSIGDYEELGRILKYDIISNSWSEYGSNFIGRRHGSATVYNGRIYYAAGNSSLDGYTQYYNTVQSIDINEVTTSVSNADSELYNFSLDQNYPNPFNPSTTISFTLNENKHVSLKVFNSIGEEMKTIIAENLSPGVHQYIFEAKGLTSGVYFYQLLIDNKVSISKKMILLK